MQFGKDSNSLVTLMLFYDHNSLKLLVVTNLGDKSLGSIAEIRIHSTSD